MDANCLFCKIGAKKIPAKLVLDEEEIFAFEDINPQAPTHILLCRASISRRCTRPAKRMRPCWASCRWPRRRLRRSAACWRGIARCSTTGAARGSLCFICTCICWVDGISAGRRDRRRGG